MYDSDCSITTSPLSFWCKSRSNGKLNHDIKLAQTTQGETSNEKTWGEKQNRNQGNKDKTEKPTALQGASHCRRLINSFGIFECWKKEIFFIEQTSSPL